MLVCRVIPSELAWKRLPSSIFSLETEKAPDAFDDLVNFQHGIDPERRPVELSNFLGSLH
nr:MAG TPA: hypothetical protein [Caudoviricetes sp.]